MPIVQEIKAGVRDPTVTGGGFVKVFVSVVVVAAFAFIAFVIWGKVSQANIPVVSAAVAPARVYIS
jgi:hypothetical protein